MEKDSKGNIELTENQPAKQSQDITVQSQAIEADKEKHRATLEMVKYIGDQLLNQIASYFRDKQKVESEITQSLFRWVVVAVVIVILVLGILTFYTKLSGEAFTTVIGMIIGSLITLIGLRIKGEPSK